MVYSMNEREPTITEIKTKIANLTIKIAEYKELQTQKYTIIPEPLPSTMFRTSQNHGIATATATTGLVSCNSYCHGKNGTSANSELPAAWKGAQCVSAGITNNIACNVTQPDPNEPSTIPTLSCLCKQNDNFLYNSNQTFVSDTDTDYMSPFLFNNLQPDINKLNTMRDFIKSEIENINNLIKQLSPKATENKTKIDENADRLVSTFEAMNDSFTELEAELAKPSELTGKYEMSKLKTSSNYGHFILIFIFTVVIVGCLIYIYSKPEEGNLDMFILILAILILVYYIYEYYVAKIRK